MVPTASLFISGVQKELPEERRAVKAFVEGDPLLRRCFTAFLFEDLRARGAKPTIEKPRAVWYSDE